MRPDGPLRRAALVAAALVVAGSTAGAASDPIPRTLRIRVEASADSFAGLRDDLRDAVRAALLRQRCFASTDTGESPIPGEIVLTVYLFGIVRETRHGQTLADRLNPRDPANVLNVESRFGMNLDATLTFGVEPVELRRMRYHVERAYRPLLESEDPEQRAYDDAIADAARETARRVCKSPRDLVRRIAAAEATPR